MSKHTPTPWIAQRPLGPQRAIDRKWEIVSPCGSGGELVVVGEHTGIDCLKDADAAFIVRAVNCHDELLAACKEAWNVLCYAAQEAQGRVKAEVVGGWIHHAAKINAIIQRAEGGGA